MGGDTNNIDEATILSLFASGYDTKPALSVPIHVVRAEQHSAGAQGKSYCSTPRCFCNATNPQQTCSYHLKFTNVLAEKDPEFPGSA